MTRQQLRGMETETVLRVRGNALAQLQVTSVHRTPLLYDALQRRVRACNAELDYRAHLAAGVVRMKRVYDPTAPLEEAIEPVPFGEGV